LKKQEVHERRKAASPLPPVDPELTIEHLVRADVVLDLGRLPEDDVDPAPVGLGPLQAALGIAAAGVEFRHEFVLRRPGRRVPDFPEKRLKPLPVFNRLKVFENGALVLGDDRVDFVQPGFPPVRLVLPPTRQAPQAEKQEGEGQPDFFRDGHAPILS
jgi:hypothetical protein